MGFREFWIVLGCICVVVGAAAGLQRAVRAQAARTVIPHEVLAFYYGWYANPRISGHWLHWAPASDQRRATNISDTPLDGLYDSHDTAEIDRQLAEAHEAGLTGLVVSWWGQHSFEDQSLALLAPRAANFGLKVSAYLETLAGKSEAEREANAVADLVYLVRSYGESPAWLRVGGHPVVFVYTNAAGQLSLSAWNRALARVRAQSPHGIAVIVQKIDPAWLAVFDGAETYGAGMPDPPVRLDQIAQVASAGYTQAVALAGEKIIAVSVKPGYDDSHLGRSHPRTYPRESGQLYSVLWQAAIRAHPDWVVIDSWNEWHEGTELEPSQEYHSDYLQETRRFASEFLKTPPRSR